jgi:hypothetical protein
MEPVTHRLQDLPRTIAHRGVDRYALLTADLWQDVAFFLRQQSAPMAHQIHERVTVMHIRPVQPTDRAEWLRMRLNLWGGAAEEHSHDIDAYFSRSRGYDTQE